MDFGRYLSIAITVVAFMFGLWILLQVLGVVTTSLNQTTDQIVTTVSTTTATVPKTIYAFQPTNPSISNNNAQGYLAQLPQCSISSNPYSGGGYTGNTGTFGLFNCVAIDYGAISVVVWFYEPTNGQGIILSFQNYQYLTVPDKYTPWLYVGTNGYLYAGDWAGAVNQVSAPINPGWHMAVVEEWASSTSGPYYIALYLDGNYIGQVPTGYLPQLFGGVTFFPYNDIGSGRSGWPSQPMINGWFFFNGAIAYVAVYNTVLTQSQVQQLYQAGFPNTLFSNNLVVAYVLVPGYYNGGGYYFVPYFVNSQIMSQMGISNAYATSITPSGSVGAIPSSQFIPLKTAFPTTIGYLVGNGVTYTVHNATGMDANKMFTPAINYAQDFASIFALVILIGLVVAFIWTRRR